MLHPQCTRWQNGIRRFKAMGKTKADFFKAEQVALMPLEQGVFDHLVEG